MKRLWRKEATTSARSESLCVTARDEFASFRLHNSVDIQECICKHRKYCYAGSDRGIDTGSDEFFEEESAYLRSATNARYHPTFSMLSMAISLSLITSAVYRIF